MKFFRKQQLKEGTVYIKLTSDFILDLYERSKKMIGMDKKLLQEQIKLFSEHLDEYIEKPSKYPYNVKKQ